MSRWRNEFRLKLGSPNAPSQTQIKNKGFAAPIGAFSLSQEALTLFTAALRQCLSYSRPACARSRIKGGTSNSNKSRI
jgi:hypothetical protein